MAPSTSAHSVQTHRSEPLNRLTGAALLRVGFYTFFPGGGIGRYTFEQMRALGRLPEIEVELICSPGFNWKDAAEFQVWPHLYDVWHPSAVRRKLYFVRGQLMNPIRAARRARKARLQVLHFANVNHLTFPLWRGRLDSPRVPIAVTVHDVRRQKSMLSRSWEERQLQAVYRRADALFVHSEYQAGELIDFADVVRELIHIVPHGPYPYGAPVKGRRMTRLGLGLPDTEPVALFFGTIRDEKNLDGFMHAMASARAPIWLLVAGKAWPGHRENEYYRRLAATLGLSDRVVFREGFVPDEEVADLFTACDWVALPYHTSFSSQSGVLNVAAHYDRPVLTSPAPVLKETVESARIGEVSEDESTDALARAIDRMAAGVDVENPYRFDEYRERYSWAENARRTATVYADLLT